MKKFIEETTHRFPLWTSFENLSTPIGESPLLDVLPVGLHRISHGALTRARTVTGGGGEGKGRAPISLAA